MKKIFILLTLLISTMTVQADDMKILQDRVSELEAQQSLNIFKFSGLLETRYDSLKASQTIPGTPTAVPFDDKTNYFRLRFSFNADAQVSPAINFYSRLTTTKFFNTYKAESKGSGTVPLQFTEFGEARNENGSQVYLEKAYADIKLGQSGATLSFGRLPTVDGPILHMNDGRPRSGTYPALVYNAVMDGLALSYSKNSDQANYSARLIHTPSSYYTLGTGKLITSPNLLTSPVTSTGSKLDTTIDLTSLMLEANYTFTDIGQLDVIYQGLQGGKFPGKGSDFNVGAGAGSGTAEFQTQMQSLTLQMSRIMNHDLQFGVSYFQSTIKNTGSITIPGAGTVFGLGASNLDEVVIGATHLVALRYGINSDFAIGGEYLNGGKNAFIYDQAPHNMTDFYKTPGIGTHYYVSYKFLPEAVLRIGATNQKYDYTAITFGTSKVTDRIIDTMYANLRLDF